MITKPLSYPKRPTELGAVTTGVRVVVQRMIVSPRAQSASLVGNDDDLLLNDTNNSTANRGWEEPGFFQHPLGQKKGSQSWFWRPIHLSPLHWCSRSSQFPAGIRRAPLAHGQVGNFHEQTRALVRFIYAGMSSPVRCLSLPGDKCPRLPFTSRCAESLSEIKPLYSKVNDACFAVQSLCLLSTVPITECRCHRWCNSIVVKGFRPPFFERVIFSLNSNQISGLNWLSRVRSRL